MRGFLLFIAVIQFSGAGAQEMKLSIIDFFGNRKLPEKTLREKILFHEGDSVKFETATILQDSSEALLKTIPGVKDAELFFVCCDDKNGHYMLFVGIDEGDQPPIRLRPAPDSPYTLPPAIMQHYDAFGRALMAAVQQGASGEEHSQGHALSEDSALRSWQYKFIDDANRHFPVLRQVLYSGKDAGHRAAAAHILGYARDKKSLVPHLLYAISDPDDEVRNNATRALGVLAAYAQKNPTAGIFIPDQPFIQLINSASSTDRNKGAMVLLSLTENKDKALLMRLKEQALPALIEMARWKNPGHAYASMMMLGRIAGVKEEEIWKAMSAGDKEAMLQKILDKL